MVNNLQFIKSFLTFDNEDEFYYIPIIRRRKDNPHLKSNHNVIAHYYIRSIEQLELEMEEIIGICEGTNARAYIYLNRRSLTRCLKEYNFKIAKQELSNHIPIVSQTYHSVVGKFSTEENKVWVVDVDIDDKKDKKDLIKIVDTLENIHPRKVQKVQMILNTPNGYHLITQGFNLLQFKNTYRDIDVHKDGPTVLYAL